MTPHKNKTAATALAFLLGALGVHRFYLKGGADRLGVLHLCCLPVAGLVYGLGRGPNPFWIVLPIMVSAMIGDLEALVIGLTPDEKWDAARNPGSGRSSSSHWILVVILVLATMVGATLVIGAMSRLFDLLYTGGAFG